MDKTRVTPTTTLKSADFSSQFCAFNRNSPSLIAMAPCGQAMPESAFSTGSSAGLLSDEVANWARTRYVEYKAGKVSEEQMCGEMVTIHRGSPSPMCYRPQHNSLTRIL